MSLTILVAGGTGRFGVVARMLIDRGHRVRVPTRDLGSPVAAELRSCGVVVVPGDFDDAASLEAAAKGVDAVFLSGTAHQAGPVGEVRHGRNMAAAAKAAGVGHVVHVSGAGADAGTGIPVLESKGEVEGAVRSLALPYTILAPVYFMENVLNPWSVVALRGGVFPSFVPVDRPVQQIPIVDIAGFAVHAIEHRSDFLGERLELASTAVTARDACAMLSTVMGRDLELREVDPPVGLRPLFDWLDRVGFSVDIAGLRAAYPQVEWHDFDVWVRTQDWRLL